MVSITLEAAFNARSALFASVASRKADIIQHTLSIKVIERKTGNDELLPSCIDKLMRAAAPYDNGNANALIVFIDGS